MQAGEVLVEDSEWLLCREGRTLFGLPVAQVAEVMRPLPIEHLSGFPPVLLGVSIIRGLPVPVISAGRLLCDSDVHPERFVTVNVDGRTIAIAVAEVIGIRRTNTAAMGECSHLLQNAAGDAVEAIAALDGDLLLLLDAARIVPPALLDELDARRSG